jgi:hypothetical protein
MISLSSADSSDPAPSGIAAAACGGWPLPSGAAEIAQGIQHLAAAFMQVGVRQAFYPAGNAVRVGIYQSRSISRAGKASCIVHPVARRVKQAMGSRGMTNHMDGCRHSLHRSCYLNQARQGKAILTATR